MGRLLETKREMVQHIPLETPVEKTGHGALVGGGSRVGGGREGTQEVGVSCMDPQRLSPQQRMLGISRAAHHRRRPGQGTQLHPVSPPIWAEPAKTRAQALEHPASPPPGSREGPEQGHRRAVRGRREMPGGPVA